MSRICDGLRANERRFSDCELVKALSTTNGKDSLLIDSVEKTSQCRLQDLLQRMKIFTLGVIPIASTASASKPSTEDEGICFILLPSIFFCTGFDQTKAEDEDEDIHFILPVPIAPAISALKRLLPRMNVSGMGLVS